VPSISGETSNPGRVHECGVSLTGKLTIQSAWEAVKKLDTVVGLAEKVGKVATYLGPFLG